jgi:hypothetical protein
MIGSFITETSQIIFPQRSSFFIDSASRSTLVFLWFIFVAFVTLHLVAAFRVSLLVFKNDSFPFNASESVKNSTALAAMTISTGLWFAAQ